ncbi:porin [Alteromonadaceae bacterium BrNp21-10]|nr:porin [Alteromonadaceae bacterium BrNp21-10]
MQNQRLLLSAIMLAFVSANATADPLTVYGKGNVTLQSTDDGEGSFSEVKSNNSRLGFKGDYDLEDGLTAFYVFEFGVDLADSSDGDNVKSRNQYIGLKGNAGSIMIGRNDTMLKRSQGKIDQFNDYEADFKNLWAGENRMSDSVTYISPSFNGFSVGITYVAEDEKGGEDAQSISVSYGDSNLKKSQFYVALATEMDMKGYDSTRVSAQAKFDDLTVGAVIHKQEAVASGVSEDGVLVSAAYAMGKITLKGQYQTLEDDSTASIGVDYKLGKNTKALAWYTSQDLDNANDKSWLAVGLEHKF